ncbi:MAG: XRE family transcriptional regulator [Peptococcaceae bacterium]|nr:XRE family transcriptional regulator [Peptococcaceae bacterium]
MDMAFIIGNNIEKLREEQNISVEQLAEIVGVTRQTMTSYLKGRQVIDSGKLARIAGHFNKPFDYFLTGDHQEFPFMFRADNPRENFDNILAEKIVRRVGNTCDLLDISGRKLVLVPESYKLRISGSRLNREEKELIEEIAVKKREDFGVADIVPDNYYRILQENGINVLAFPFENSAIFAVSAYSSECGSFIVINDDAGIPEERKMFSAVHELGHLIFHREQYLKGFNSFSHTYGKKRNINEEVANHFAMCFLVSRSLMRKYRNIFKNKDFLLREIMEIKSVFLVSAKCLIYALEYYGYITEKQKGTHIGYLNKNGYSTAEPRPMQSIEKGAYWQGVIRELFNREEISLSKISEVLEIPLSQARMLTSGKSLLRFAGAIDPDDLKTIEQAIQEECEKVDQSDW